MKAQRAAAWNTRRAQVLQDVLGGVAGAETWELLSRHNTCAAAYIAQNRLRKATFASDLLTVVKNRTDDDVDWNGELWISHV